MLTDLFWIALVSTTFSGIYEYKNGRQDWAAFLLAISVLLILARILRFLGKEKKHD